MENELQINTVVFDLGGVLIDWNPLYVFDENYFESLSQREHFFKHICTGDWNENQDAGYSISKATEERVKLFPEWEKPIRDFYGRWEEMLGDAIEDTLSLFKRMKEKEVLKFYALTNWSAETFPVALQRFNFLQWFDGLIVSGEEKTRKPFPEFYNILSNRYGVTPVNALFIDDNERNIKAAALLGYHTVHFTSPKLLEDILKNMKLI